VAEPEKLSGESRADRTHAHHYVGLLVCCLVHVISQRSVIAGESDALVTTLAGGVRARAREEMRRLILDAGRARLAADGPEALSLRAVARDVGLVSSAVYRYVANRDALLTELIIESYDALGTAAEKADAAVDRADLVGRFVAVGRATRAWGLAHPHE